MDNFFKHLFIIFLILPLIVLTGCGRSSDTNENYDDKIKKAQKTLEKNYKNPKTHTHLGILYEKKGLIQQAEKHYRIAVELDPKFPEAILNLGNLYFKEKDFPSSIQTLQIALELNPNDPKIHYLLATVYKESKQFQEALHHYQKVLELDPKHLLAQNFLGVVFYELKEFQKAEEAFNKVLILDLYFADAYGNLGILYDFNLNDKEKAVEYYEKFLELKKDGENVNIMRDRLQKTSQELLRAAQLAEEEKAKQARKTIHEQERIEIPRVPASPKAVPPTTRTPIEIVVTKEPSSQLPPPTHVIHAPGPVKPPTQTPSSMTHFNQGVLCQSKGQNAQAIVEYEKAIALNPANVKAHYNLGILYKWKGDYERAAREYRETIRLDPHFAKAYYNLGIILKGKGQVEDAIAKFKQAIQIDPRYSDAYLGLGLIYSQNKKDMAQAVSYYKKYLQLNPSGPTASKIRSWLHSIGETG